MRVETLEAYNIGSDILRVWRDTVGPELLPVQERAVKEFGLFADGNLIVFSPTSSGKTFIGEMAAAKAAREETKVVYLVPQKALAEEKFQEFRRRYERLGIRVVVSSRDHREYDDAIEQRAFEIAIVVFEKMQNLLVARPQILRSVGLVVVDELQLITDETRGPTLELLLTKLRLADTRPRILGLSAVLGRAQSLAEWMGARLLIDTRRPVELRKGVLCRGTYTYREHNSGAQSTEDFTDCGSEKRQDMLLAAAADLARRGEQVLIFLPDRVSTVALARLFADRVRMPSLEPALDELREQEETHARDALREVLGSSVAFHNADLSPEERELVERHFRSGGIRALFSTSTLAMGLNLPVKNVVLDGKRWQYLRRYGRWSLEDVTKSDYENMSGRAGRLAFTNDFGRSVLVTSSRFEADVWLRHYVGGDFEDIVPTLKDAPLENHVINLLASKLAGSRDELCELLLSSFTGHVYWTQKMSRDEFGAALDRALRLCIDGGLVRDDARGRVGVTDLGRACATKGLDVETGIALAAWADEARVRPLTDLEVLTVVSLTHAGDNVYVSMSNDERYKADYRRQLVEQATTLGVVERPVFQRFTSERWAIEYAAAKSLKKALFLGDWIDEVATKDIEHHYRVWAGSLRRAGEEYAWLVEGLAAVAKASGWSDARCQEVEELSSRLVHGVRTDALGIARIHVRGLGRTLMRRLVRAGFGDADALRTAGADAVRAAVGHRGAFGALWARLDELAVPAKPSPYPEVTPDVLRAAEPPVPYGESPVLAIDIARHRVCYRGIEIPTKPPGNLQPQLFRVLAVLALHAGEPVTMARMADEMFALGGLRRKPVAPDQRDLRYRLVRVLREVLAPRVAAEEVDQVVENLAGVGLRLTCTAAVVGGRGTA